MRRLPWVVAALLTLGALPVTVSRLVGWTGDLGIVLTSFAPLALLPYAAATALAVPLSRRSLTRPAVVVAAVAAALVVTHLVWIAPLYLGGAPAPAAGADRVTVLGANVQFGRGDAAVVVREIGERGVDVRVVSEVTPRFVAAAEQAGLDELLPYRAGRAGTGAGGTLVYSSEPIEVVAPVATAFESFVLRTHDLTVLATHPAPPQSPGFWRVEQPLLLTAATDHDVDLVVGDLNATLDHPTIRDLADAGWRDAVELTNGGFAPTWPAHGERAFPFPVVQIDHVLARSSVAVLEVDALEVPDTDHYAVVATVASTT